MQIELDSESQDMIYKGKRISFSTLDLLVESPDAVYEIFQAGDRVLILDTPVLRKDTIN